MDPRNAPNHRNFSNSRNTPDSAADRMRPILSAMERSIDEARRKRMSAPPMQGNPPVSSRSSMSLQSSAANAASERSIGSVVPPSAAAVIGDAPPVPPGQAPAGEGAPPRLKARPKRMDAPFSSFNQPTYRSQAS